MVAEGRDGTLWSALTGVAFAGPQKGKRLERIPSLTTEWGHWMMLHPESTAYDLFDGKKYTVTPLPDVKSSDALASRGVVLVGYYAWSGLAGAQEFIGSYGWIAEDYFSIRDVSRRRSM